MYAWRQIKKQRFKCWSDQFITNVNRGDGERGGRTLLRIGVMGKGRRAKQKLQSGKNAVSSTQKISLPLPRTCLDLFLSKL